MASEHWRTAEIIARLELSRREDPFSIQYASSRDPKFWIRVMLPVAQSVEFTDLLPGKMSEAEQAEALHVVLCDAASGMVKELVFQDISPAGNELALQRARLVRVVELYASARGRFIAQSKVQERRGKHDLRVVFRL